MGFAFNSFQIMDILNQFLYIYKRKKNAAKLKGF